MSVDSTPRPATRSAGPEEGWYPDPARDRDTFRWWTGDGWSRWLTTDPDAPAPPDAHSVGLEVARPDETRRTPHRVRTLAMLVAVILLLISAAVAVGWDRREPVAFANPAPSATFTPPVTGRQIDDRTVTINGEVRLDYAEAFGLDPTSVDGVAGSCVLATHEIGKGDGRWRAYVIFGQAEDELNDVDVRTAAQRVLSGMVTAMNNTGKPNPSLQDLTFTPRPDLGPDQTALELTATIRGDWEEDLRIIIVDLEHRRRVVYAESAKPNKNAEGEEALTRTRESLRRV